MGESITKDLQCVNKGPTTCKVNIKLKPTPPGWGGVNRKRAQTQKYERRINKDTGDIPSYRRIKKNFNPFEEAPEPARTEAPKQNPSYYSGNTPGYQLYGQPVRLAADMTYGGDNRYVQVTGTPNSAYGDNKTVDGFPDNRSDNATGSNKQGITNNNTTYSVTGMDLLKKNNDCMEKMRKYGALSGQFGKCWAEFKFLEGIYNEQQKIKKSGQSGR